MALPLSRLLVGECATIRGPKIIGMIHVAALPGTPRNNKIISEITGEALRDAEVYNTCGVDGVIVENMNDVPYIRREFMGPETVACMTAVCAAVRRALNPGISVGVQVLSGGNEEALAVATAAGLQFVRCEGYVFAHIGDEGWIESCAGQLLRYRRRIGAESVRVLADIKKKHSSHSVTQDVSLSDTVHAADMFLADGVVLTGIATGRPTSVCDVREARSACGIPVLVGSGVTADNVSEFMPIADGLIIGSHFKINGDWRLPVERNRVSDFMTEVRNIRKASQ